MEARIIDPEEKSLELAPALFTDWEQQKEVILIWPERIRAGVSRLKGFYRRFADQLTEHTNVRLIISPELEPEFLRSQFVSPDRVHIEKISCPDIWTRDFMPLAQRYADRPRGIKALYAPAYLKGRNEIFAVESNNAAILISEALGYTLDIITNEDGLPLILDGGNITVNGSATAICTNRIISDNESWSVEELRSVFAKKLGITNLIIVPCEPGDVTGHVDGMIRFINNETVVVADSSSGYEKKFHDRIAAQCKASGLNVLRIKNYYSNTEVRKDGTGISSAAGNYVNFFRCGETIFLPKYNNVKGYDEASAALTDHGLKVVAVEDADELAALGGVLNCITWSGF